MLLALLAQDSLLVGGGDEEQKHQVPGGAGSSAYKNKSTCWTVPSKGGYKVWPPHRTSKNLFWLGITYSSYALAFKYYRVTPSRLNTLHQTTTWFFVCCCFSIKWTTRKTKGRNHRLQFPGERVLTCANSPHSTYTHSQQRQPERHMFQGTEFPTPAPHRSLREALELHPAWGWRCTYFLRAGENLCMWTQWWCLGTFTLLLPVFLLGGMECVTDVLKHCVKNTHTHRSIKISDSDSFFSLPSTEKVNSKCGWGKDSSRQVQAGLEMWGSSQARGSSGPGTYFKAAAHRPH